MGPGQGEKEVPGGPMENWGASEATVEQSSLGTIRFDAVSSARTVMTTDLIFGTW